MPSSGLKWSASRRAAEERAVSGAVNHMMDLAAKGKFMDLKRFCAAQHYGEPDYLLLIHLLLDDKDTRDAAANLAKWVAKQPGPPIELNGIANLFLQKNKFRHAIEFHLELLQKNAPKDTQLQIKDGRDAGDVAQLKLVIYLMWALLPWAAEDKHELVRIAVSDICSEDPVAADILSADEREEVKRELRLLRSEGHLYRWSWPSQSSMATEANTSHRRAKDFWKLIWDAALESSGLKTGLQQQSLPQPPQFPPFFDRPPYIITYTPDNHIQPTAELISSSSKPTASRIDQFLQISGKAPAASDPLDSLEVLDWLLDPDLPEYKLSGDGVESFDKAFQELTDHIVELDFYTTRLSQVKDMLKALVKFRLQGAQLSPASPLGQMDAPEEGCELDAEHQLSDEAIMFLMKREILLGSMKIMAAQYEARRFGCIWGPVDETTEEAMRLKRVASKLRRYPKKDMDHVRKLRSLLDGWCRDRQALVHSLAHFCDNIERSKRGSEEKGTPTSVPTVDSAAARPSGVPDDFLSGSAPLQAFLRDVGCSKDTTPYACDDADLGLEDSLQRFRREFSKNFRPYFFKAGAERDGSFVELLKEEREDVQGRITRLQGKILQCMKDLAMLGQVDIGQFLCNMLRRYIRIWLCCTLQTSPTARGQIRLAGGPPTVEFGPDDMKAIVHDGMLGRHPLSLPLQPHLVNWERERNARRDDERQESSELQSSSKPDWDIWNVGWKIDSSEASPAAQNSTQKKRPDASQAALPVAHPRDKGNAVRPIIRGLKGMIPEDEPLTSTKKAAGTAGYAELAAASEPVLVHEDSTSQEPADELTVAGLMRVLPAKDAGNNEDLARFCSYCKRPEESIAGHGAKMQFCSGCKPDTKVAYCSKDCQSRDWPAHKLTCKWKKT